MKASKLLTSVLVFYFLIPYFLFFRFFNLSFQIDFQELVWAFKNSFIQSFSAATLVTALAIPMSLGLFQMRGHFYQVTLRLLLLPQILPSFFSILIAFSIWKPFPLGTVGIGFIFLLVHLGFAVIFLHTAIQEKLGFFPVVGQVFGLKKISFIFRIAQPLLRTDLLSCLLMIFVFCFSSFSIPLIAGGGRDTNIEVLIFEKIFINQNWSAAWTVALLQSLFLGGLSFFLLRQQGSSKQTFFYSGYLQSSLGYVLIIFYLFVFLAGYGVGILQALPEFIKLKDFSSEVVTATFNTLRFLLIYFLLSFGLLYLWLWDFCQNLKFNFANHLIAGSTMIVGLTFYLIFPSAKEWDTLKVPVAMSILVFPVLFKSFLEKPIWDLRDQVVTARVFGISNHFIVLHILLKRIQQPLSIWFSFLSIWFLSDFAVLRALGTQTETLGLLAQGFLSSYRLSMAYLLSVYILLVWLFVLGIGFVCRGVFRVFDKKFKLTI